MILMGTRSPTKPFYLSNKTFWTSLTVCPQCGGPLTLIAAIKEPAVIAKILAHLGLPSRVHHEPRPASTNSSRQPKPTLDSGSIPGADRFPLPRPHPTHHKRATGWPNPRKSGSSDTSHKRNVRRSNSKVWKLNPQHGFWYVAA